jgi:uncharacterized protein (DUF433 family)
MASSSRKGEPIHVRLSQRSEEILNLEARRLGVGRSTLVARYTEEALRMRLFPGIIFTGPEHARRATVLGTGLDVWEIVSLRRDFDSREKLTSEYENLDTRALDLADGYAREFPDEIEHRIVSGGAEQVARLYPFILREDDAASP